MIVFLFKEMDEIIEKWPVNGSNKKRTIEGKINVNEVEMVEAESRKFSLKSIFYFIPVKNVEEIKEIMDKTGVSSENVVIITTTRKPFFQDKEKQKKKKRYDFSSDYGWIFYIKSQVGERDINEFVSEFSAIGKNQKTNQVREKVMKERIKEILKNGNNN